MFAAKFPQIITHEKRLIGCQNEVRVFLDVIACLDTKLGPLLLQFPSSFRIELFGALARFLGQLPDGFCYAVEVRHCGWLNARFFDLLCSYHIAFALVDLPWLPRQVVMTTDFTYIRWMGDRDEIMESFSRVQLDRSADLQWWVERVGEMRSPEVDVYDYLTTIMPDILLRRCSSSWRFIRRGLRILKKMLSTWRLLNTEQNDAAMNMAIDEAILLTQEFTPRPTLRFYDWTQPAFSFGYFQQIADEVDVVACASHGIELVRRMTGGGTVIHGWDVTYTVVVPHGSGVLPKDISSAYGVISDCLINGLQCLHIDAKRQVAKPGSENSGDASAAVNVCLTNPAQYDIMLNGKKIAGVSQRRNRIGVIYQGYIAIDMPPPNVLVLASKRLSFVQIVVGRSTAINIGQAVPVNRAQLENAVAAGFEETLGIRLVEGEHCSQTVEAAKFLAHTKYATAEWNFRR